MRQSNPFFTIPTPHGKNVEYHAIPFEAYAENGFAKELPPCTDIAVGKNCEALFFLGMTSRNARCSDWWGKNERYSDYFHRTFIGDRIAHIAVIYEDNSSDLIPVIFGVNAWSYDLYEEPQPGESTDGYGGPYREPFQSDAAAGKLLENSLRLMRNEDGAKGDKYILGIKTDPDKKIIKVYYYEEVFKYAGVVISGITALLAGGEILPEWTLTDYRFYVSQQYIKDMDLLMRRLYQFREDIPQTMAYEQPANYRLPVVRFDGCGIADLYTNVYAHNLFDIGHHKINPEGKLATSTLGFPNFGLYVGFGTFARKSIYAEHMWSRDMGRVLTEAIRGGADTRIRSSCDILHKYLYDKSTRYAHPNWKRVINAAEVLPPEQLDNFSGKENDGHAALMLAIYNAFMTGAIDTNWLLNNEKPIRDAADWFIWQIENPKLSGFNGVLYSETEAATQHYAGKDLFSNTYAYFAMRGYARLMEKMNDHTTAETYRRVAGLLRKGIMENFICDHPRFGKIFTDTLDDCWTYEYKRMAPLFLQSDFMGYDPLQYDAAFLEIARRTFLAQKEEYYDPASGRQMGYGQGYLTLSALMLDAVDEYSDCIEYAAMFSYHHTDCPDCRFITPEGVIAHPSHRFWFRNGDLGNAVQQGEIVKCGRLIIGLDDIAPQHGLSVIPRLPHNWNGYTVEKWPISVPDGQDFKQMPVNAGYSRIENGYRFTLSAAEGIKLKVVRFGPFAEECERFAVSGQFPYVVQIVNHKKYVYIPMEQVFKDVDLAVISL